MSPEDLQLEAEALAARLVHAFAAQSIDACMELMPPLDEYRLLTNQPRLSERKYRRQRTKQCTEFFDKYERFFGQHAERLTNETIAEVTVKEHDELIRQHAMFSHANTTTSVTITASSRTEANGDLTSLRFSIEFAVLLSSRLWVHNFVSVTASQLIDSSTKAVGPLADLGFQMLEKANYATALGVRHREIHRLMDSYNSHWYFDGDVHLRSDQIALFRNACVLISGDLTVDGLLDTDYVDHLFVLGDVRATNIILSEGLCIFGGVTRFDTALLILSGVSARISEVVGPIFANNSEAADVVAVNDSVQVCADWETGRVFGEQLLKPEFIATEGRDVFVDLDSLYTAIMNGTNPLA